VAVADTYDAMTSDRSYRKALPHEVAIAELERCSGSQFDPAIVEIFLREIEEHRKRQIAAGIDVPR
jgi:HD-GYP domain-containing protein (c-di-GMP phosphodiesterase class II)